VRWIGTALAVGARGRPCYRCLFEDVPAEGVANCAEAGVMGPVVGIVAAAQVDLALALVDGIDVAGQLVTFDGRAPASGPPLRRRTVPPRAECPLCGTAPRIRRIESESYRAPACAG
jgi:molybdopterin/thiamine biosynthesis adenylyltransferase